jgi:hypothetical protein
MTFSFSHTARIWKTKYSFEADDYCHSGDSFISFKGDEESIAWTHNSKQVPANNFYGQQYNSQIEVVANNNPSSEKVFNSVGVECLQNNFKVSVEARHNVEDGSFQSCEIESMVKKEGNLYAALKKSSKSTSNVIYGFEVIQGQDAKIAVNVNKSTSDFSGYYKVAFVLPSSQVYTLDFQGSWNPVEDVNNIWEESTLSLYSIPSELSTINLSSQYVIEVVPSGSIAILVSDPSINGDSIRGKYAKVKVTQKDGSKPFELFCVNVNHTNSKLDSSI